MKLKKIHMKFPLNVVYEIVLDETVGGLVEESVHLISHLYGYLP